MWRSKIMQHFAEIKKEIEDIMMRYKGGKELAHANGTLNWLLKIKPDADDAMKIAAFGHDIERCVVVRKESPDHLIVDDFAKYQVSKREHAERGAEAAVEILEKYGVNEAEKERVRFLIAHHEIGGDDDADAICDADSLSYLTDVFDDYLKMYGPNRAKVKLEWMFGRISEARKKLGLEVYNEALRKIKNFI